MQELSEKIFKSLRNNLVVVLLGLFLIIDILSLSVITRVNSDTLLNISGQSAPSVNAEQSAASPIPTKVLKISEIKGPRIDDQAAMVVINETAVGTSGQSVRCLSLPAEIWVFLLLAYIALLLFNLTYDFERTTKIQWGFELVLTLLALIAWYVWDACHTSIWFPLYVIKFGILIYAAYLYFFERKTVMK